jgi:hypothetical protein
MQFPFRDLTNQYISLSYQDVVQRYAQGTASYFLDGLGNVLGFIPIGSLGQQLITADQPVPFAISASYALNGGGSGISASYAQTASYAVTYSFVTQTTIADRAYSADEADLAETASYALTTGLVISASHANLSDAAYLAADALHADTASFTLFCDLAANSAAADYAETASVAIFAQTASYAIASNIISSSVTDEYFAILFATGSGPVPIVVDGGGDFYYNPARDLFYVHHILSDNITSSLYGTASYSLDGYHAAQSDTASLTLFASFADSASYALESTLSDTASFAFYGKYAGSSSYALTASVALNVPLTSSNADTASYLVGFNFVNTGSWISITNTDTPVIQMITGSYDAAFFDYVALSGSNTRAGMVFGSWVNGLINYTEVSNVDVGDTSRVTMSLALAGNVVQLIANVTDTTPWKIKALARYL